MVGASVVRGAARRGPVLHYTSGVDIVSNKSGHRVARVAIAALAGLSLHGCATQRSTQRPVDPPRMAQTSAAESAAPYARSLLWRVSRDGRTSYLFGTVHIGVTANEALGQEGRAALSRSRVVCAEVVPSNEQQQEAVRVMQGARLRDDESLRAILGDALWSKLTRQLAMLDPAGLDRFEPWFALVMVIGTAQSRGAPSQDPPAKRAQPSRERAAHARSERAEAVPMDDQIVQLGRARGAQVTGLETLGEALQSFARIERGSVVSMLRAFLENPAAAQAVGQGIVDEYRSENAEQSMDQLAELTRRFSPEFARHLLDERNARWVQRLDPMLREGGVFVAVGAAHMGGERGLVRKLRSMGYDVRRVRAGER